MKKLLVIALAAIFVLAFAAMAMAEATLSGEIATGFTTKMEDKDFGGNGKTTSSDFAKAKVALNGKLGDDCTGTAVILGDPVTSDGSAIKWDEADVVFTKDFGTLKFGYYGWNNNLKDILDTFRNDVKSQFVSSAAIKAGENVTIGIAYGYQASDDKGKKEDANADNYGIDLGYATDVFGVDVIMTNTGANKIKINGTEYGPIDLYSTTGVQGWYKVADFKLFVQYITEDAKSVKDACEAAGVKDPKVSPTNEIIGFTYEPAENPFYARFEYDLSAQKDLYGDDVVNAMGIRVGYKLADGAKIEYQNKTNTINTNETYLKLICAF